MYKSILFFALIISRFTAAQAPDYDDLKILYANGNYSKLIKYSRKYCKSNKTKNDPLPYMWLARGYYKNSRDGKYSEDEQKQNLQQAITELSNCLKLDSNKLVQENYYSLFHDFKTELSEEIINEIESDEPTIFWLSEYYKISPNSVGARYIEGYYEALMKNERCADLLWTQADSILSKEGTEFYSRNKAERELLQTGIFLATNYMMNNNQSEKAKTLVLKLAPYFINDPVFNLQYEIIME